MKPKLGHCFACEREIESECLYALCDNGVCKTLYSAERREAEQRHDKILDDVLLTLESIGEPTVPIRKKRWWEKLVGTK